MKIKFNFKPLVIKHKFNKEFVIYCQFGTKLQKHINYMCDMFPT